MKKINYLFCTLLCCLSFYTQADIKIGFIDGLSGPMANAGEAALNQFRAANEFFVKSKGGVLGGQSFQFIPIDNKGNAQESLVALKSATDQGIRIIVQGNGSGAAAALIDAINKWNIRHPEKSVLFLNYGAVDPTLTNEKCSFWHFRFDANSAMRLEAMTDYIAADKAIKRVFILGQNYAHGQQVSLLAKQLLKNKSPSIAIVGDDLHPLGSVKDFSPYVMKIKASKADAVITGNWGNDLALLIKSAKSYGIKAKFFTFYAGSIGSPSAIGSSGSQTVIETSDWHRNLYSNQKNNRYEIFADWYNKTYPSYEIYTARMVTMLEMLAAAINRIGKIDPKFIAYELEGMKYQAHNGEVEMRKEDHQLLQPLHVSIFSPVDKKSVYIGLEGTSYGFKTLRTVSTKNTTQEHKCQMIRPE